jgi:soluble lytic murein transglycosylase-like protein
VGASRRKLLACPAAGYAVLPARSLLCLTAVLMLAPALDAAAGTLYRCVGKHGESAFTSDRTGYSQCRAVQAYVDPAPVAAATPALSPKARVEFRTSNAAAPPPVVPAPAGSGTKVTSGTVYRYKKNGVTHYTNRRPAGEAVVAVFSYVESCFACALRPGLDFSSVALNTTAYIGEVSAAAAEAGIDAAFVRAIIHAESSFNPQALSNKGAQGLMQLMPATAERFGVNDAFSAEDNIRGGTRYLAWLLKRFNGDTRLAAAGYNAGEGAVDRFSGVPPYDETQRFVERVGILHSRYQSALAALPPGPAGRSAAAGAP